MFYVSLPSHPTVVHFHSRGLSTFHLSCDLITLLLSATWLVVVVGFYRSRKTMEYCAAEFSSVSAPSGVAEETDAGVRVTFSVALCAGEGGQHGAVFLRDLFSSACCVRFSSKTERDPSSRPVSR